MLEEAVDSLVAEALEGIEKYRETVPFVRTKIPDALLNSLARYVEHRMETGGFLRAVLENDWAEAIGRADWSLHLGQLKALQELIHCYFPAAAHGSSEKVAAWLAGKSEE